METVGVDQVGEEFTADVRQLAMVARRALLMIVREIERQTDTGKARDESELAGELSSPDACGDVNGAVR